MPPSSQRPRVSITPTLVTFKIQIKINGTCEMIDVVSRVERALIEHVLKTCGGNRMQASKQLGMSRSTLYRMMRELGIDHGMRNSRSLRRSIPQV